MAYTAAALSLLLANFGKPIVLTGSQIPLALPRSDARQNLIDSLTCAVSSFYPPHVQLLEVCICFGGKLLRGNRAQKWNSTVYQAFNCPSYPVLATLGVDVEWNKDALLQPVGVYRECACVACSCDEGRACCPITALTDASITPLWHTCTAGPRFEVGAMLARS